MKYQIVLLLVSVVVSACGGSDNNDNVNDSANIPVWLSNSVRADLYLATFGELESDVAEPPATIGTILRQTATPEQLTELQSLKVDRPFEYSRVICDIPAGYDIFYLVITDQDGTTRRFSQYSICGFSQGDGFFQAEADGFLEEQKICDFGMSFGIMGFQCNKP